MTAPLQHSHYYTIIIASFLFLSARLSYFLNPSNDRTNDSSLATRYATDSFKIKRRHAICFHYTQITNFTHRIFVTEFYTNLTEDMCEWSFTTLTDSICICEPGSTVGIAAGYGLDGPGIESRWGRYFPHLSRPALGPTQSPIQWVPGLSRGYKAAGAWRWPLTPLVPRSKNRVDLYLPKGLRGLWKGWNLPTNSIFLLHEFAGTVHMPKSFVWRSV
jgi:hypothetical protein